MNYDGYFYVLVVLLGLAAGVRYLLANFRCKKCGSWKSEVDPRFEISNQGPHEYVRTRYCNSCGEEIVDVARVEVTRVNNKDE
ncbi:MAG: hypothetical protein M0P64_00170 [Candidatus Pacebacteria bacterium]|nr:hypothetical protein [Candidatus Paceibacterota bacterium]